MEPSTTTELRARNGARLSPVTIPGHNLGRAAPNKGMKLPTETYTWPEFNALMNACSTRGACGLRDRALLATMVQTAARTNELLSAEARDFDLDNLDLHIRFPKRDRRGDAAPRHVPLNAAAAAIIEKWAWRRDKLLAEVGLAPGRRLPMFCVVDRRSRGQKQHGSVWRDRIKALGEKAGIEKRVHSHGLRKTCATTMHIDEGAPLQVVQKILGHKHISTTSIYLSDAAATAAAAKFGRARIWPGEQPAATPDLAVVLAAAIEAQPELLAAALAALGDGHPSHPS